MIVAIRMISAALSSSYSKSPHVDSAYIMAMMVITSLIVVA